MVILARARVIVTGNVQGVFFRSTTRSKARLLGLKGWVRNLPDGSLEVVIEGNRDDVETLIEFCKKGPEGADVFDARVEWDKYRGEFQDFEIKY